MKTLKNTFILAFLYLLVPLQIWSQECTDYHEHSDCIMDRDRAYKKYSQSKSVLITIHDTVELNIIFYGQKDYILSFCADKLLYPVHFWFKDPSTGEVLYDNSQDNYIGSLNIGFEVTRPLNVMLNVVGKTAVNKDLNKYIGCVGLLIQYKDYP
jgi:hypothetical protein